MGNYELDVSEKVNHKTSANIKICILVHPGIENRRQYAQKLSALFTLCTVPKIPIINR